MAIGAYDQFDEIGASNSSGPVLGGVAGKLTGPLIPVWCGNSIAQFGQYDDVSATKGFDQKSEIVFALGLAPIGFFTTKITASAIGGKGVVDVFGNYGFSGQDLATITNDASETWVNALRAGGLKPTLVCGMALFENSIYNNGVDAFEKIKSDFCAWVRLVRLIAPQAIIQVSTPHADGRINQRATPALVADSKRLWLAVRDWLINTIDNNYDIFVTDMMGIEGCCTVGDPTEPIPGTYVLDGNKVHPNGTGASRNGRLVAATFRRISSRVVFPNVIKSGNLGMTGSIAISLTTYAQGTQPTTSISATPTIVFSQQFGTGTTAPKCVASGPGEWTITATAVAAGAAIYIQMATPTILPVGNSMGMISAAIKSGAPAVKVMHLDHTVFGTPANVTTVTNTASPAGSADPCVFKDGDSFVLVTATLAKPATTTTNIASTWIVFSDTVGVPITLVVRSMGYVDQGVA